MSLQVWLPLNGDLKNNGLLGNTIVTNHGATVDNNGKIGKCYAFDNNTSYISIQHNQLYKILNGSSQPMSICFWVFHADTTRAIIFGDYNVTGGNNFNIELATNHTLRWYWSSPDIGISAMNVGLSTWTHVAFTYDGAILKGYINGVEKYSNAVTLGAKNRSSGEYYIGRDNRTGTTTLNGKLNDFRIYDHCLSVKEIEEISKGLVFHLKLDQPAINNIFYDSSGNGYNGTMIQTINMLGESPRYNDSIYITATNQKIKITGFTTTGFSNSYTFAWWEKISSVSPMHWGFSDGVRLNGMYTGRLWNTGDGSNNPLYNPGTTTQVTAPSVNVWHHWAMIGNGTKCLVYQDGELWAEAKTYKTITGTTIYINGWDTSTSYCSDDASMSDFRLYATALTAEQIKELYNTSASIDNKGNVYARELVEI